MATEKILKTRILLKYDTVENWEVSSLILKAGEVAIGTIPSVDGSETVSPVIKVGDGEHTWSGLGYLYAKAADVAAWAKAANKPVYAASEITGLEDFIAGEIQDTNTQYKIVKVSDTEYKLQQKEINGAWADAECDHIIIPQFDPSELEADIKENADAIAAINNSTSGILAQAKSYADGLNTAMDGRVDALETAIGEGGSVENQINSAIEALKLSETYATKGEVNTLSGKVGTVEEGSTVVGMIGAVDEKVQNLIDNPYNDSEVRGLISDNADAIEELSKTHGTDKKALEDAIALKADKTALEAEIERAGKAEKANADEIARVNGVLVNALENNAEGLDSIKELADWISKHGTDAASYAEAIADLEELVGTESVADQIDAKIEAQNLSQYAKQSDLEAATGRLTTVEGKVTTAEGNISTLEGKVSTAEGKISTLEDKVDVEKVSTAISNAIAAQDFSSFTTDAEHEALVKRVGDLETADGLQDGLLAGLRTDVDSKASQADLDALEGLVGETAVGTQIDNKISALKLSETYEPIGEAAKEAGVVNTALEAYKTSNNAAVAKVVEDLAKEVKRAGDEETRIEGLVGEVAQDVVDLTTVVNGKADASTLTNFQATVGNTYETKVDATAKLTEAKGYTNTEVAKVQGEVDALEELVGELPADAGVETVIAYIEKRTSGIATSDNLTQLSNRVSTIEGDYLKAADKTELSGLINTEKERAMGVEGGLETRLAAVEGDYLKAADKTELQGNIDTKVAKADYDLKVKALEDEDARIAGLVSAEETRAKGVEEGLDAEIKRIDAALKLAVENDTDGMDSIKELANWINTHGTEASEMAKAIDALEVKVDVEKVSTAISGAISDLDLANTYEPKGAEARAKAYADGLAGNYEVAGAAAKALKDAKDYADGLDQAMDSRVDALELKLKDVEANADVNVIETVKVNGVTLTPDANKAVDVTVPTGALASKNKVAESDLENALATKLNGKVDSVAVGDGLKVSREGNAVTIDLDSDFVEFIFDCGTSAVR